MDAGSYNQDEARNQEPYVEITEQPASKSLRFRYISDKTPGSAISGVKTTAQTRTSPTITIHNYIGHVIILVYCVTKEEPYKPHPHYLVNTRKERCYNGVWKTHHYVSETSKEYHLKHIAIQCVKKLDVPGALRDKMEVFEKINIKADFSHMNSYQDIDLNALRLCFQVITTDEKRHHLRTLKPVVSDIIYNKSSLCNLNITKTMPSSGPVSGDTEVIVLCDKLVGDVSDTKVVFYLEERGLTVWQAFAETTLVHRHVAVVFKTPTFFNLRIREDVKVQYRLYNGADTSKPCEFVYIADYREVQYKTKTISEYLDQYSIDLELSRPPVQRNEYPLQENQHGNELAIVNNGSNTPKIKYEYVQDAQATVLGAALIPELLAQETQHNMQQSSNTQWPPSENEMPGPSYNIWPTCPCTHSSNQPRRNEIMNEPNFDYNLPNAMSPGSIMQQPYTDQANDSRMDTDNSGSISESNLFTPEDFSDILMNLLPTNGIIEPILPQRK